MYEGSQSKFTQRMFSVRPDSCAGFLLRGFLDQHGLRRADHGTTYFHGLLIDARLEYLQSLFLRFHRCVVSKACRRRTGTRTIDKAE